MALTQYQLRPVGDAGISNAMINGNFDIWQRGTSFATIANNTYTADRFAYVKSGSAVHTVSQETSVLPTVTQSNFNSRYSLKLQPSTSQASPGATDFYAMTYRMEGQDYSAIHGQSARLQFWVYNSVAGTYGASFQNSAQTRTYAATYTVNSANTWEKKTIDLALDTGGTWLFDNTVGLRVNMFLTAGSSQTVTPGAWGTTSAGTYGPSGMTNTFNASTSNVCYFAQVALIPGKFDSSANTAFKRAGRNVADETSMCQRYYYRPNVETIVSASGSMYATGWAFATTGANSALTFPVRMRVAPTYSSSGSLVVFRINTTVAASSSSIDQNGNDSIRLQFAVASGLTQGEGIGLGLGNTSSYIDFSAEL